MSNKCDVWVAAFATLFIHAIAALIFASSLTVKRDPPVSRTLEAFLITPSQASPIQSPPSKAVPIEKQEAEPLPKAIQQNATPEPEPLITSEEQFVAAEPIQEVPLKISSPAEETIVLPKYNAAYLNNRPPSYPQIARRMNIEGTVLLRVLISRAGLPEQVDLEQSSGSSALDNAAIQTVWSWSFIPARKGTEAIAAWVIIPVNFNLNQ
jgi:protein TonB